MAKPLLPDALWVLIQPLFPTPTPSPKGGRPRLGNREALTGLLFVLVTGIPWEYLPQELGCGSGMTCWRRLRDWQQADLWNKLHLLLLEKLSYADQIDWSRVCVDASSVPAPKGGQNRPQSDRPRQGGNQASPCHRSQRHSVGGKTVGGQYPRNHALLPDDRCVAHPG